MAPFTKQRLLPQKRPKIIDLIRDVLTTTDRPLTFDELNERVSSLAGYTVPHKSIQRTTSTLRSRGVPIQSIGREPTRYIIESDQPLTKRPKIIDLIRDVLTTTDTPMTAEELNERVSSLAGRKVSPGMIQVTTSALRSRGASIQSIGREPTRYIIGELPVEELPVEELPVEELPVEELPVEEPRIIDLTVYVLSVADTPLTFSEVSKRVGTLARHPVLKNTLRYTLIRLRSRGVIQSIGENPTRYTMSASNA